MKKLNVLIILFTIFLIALPFGGCARKEVTVYFAVEEDASFYLTARKAVVDPSPDPYHASLEALIKGPDTDNLFATLPASVKLNSVSIENSLAIADFSKELLTDTSIPHSSTTETLAIYSIVNTLTEFEEIQRVRIIIEGQETGTIDGLYIEDFWGHIGLSQDFSRNQDIIFDYES